MTELDQNQIIKWTGLIAEHPEAIVSLGRDATYPLIRLAVEHEAPQYALDSVKQGLLENVYHDIDVENANDILYKTDHYSEPVHGIIFLDKDKEGGESVKFDSNEITIGLSFSRMDYDKYDVTLRDLPSAYSNGRHRYENYDVYDLRNILLHGRIKLTDIDLPETEQYVYVADVLNELSKLGYYELVERLLEDLYEHDMTAYIKLSDVFYGWAATDYFIQKELQRKRPEYTPYSWTNGYDIKLNREDLIRVKKEKADKEVMDAKPLFSDEVLSYKDKKKLIEDNLDENSAEKMLNQAMFAFVTGVILFGVVILGFMLLSYLF